MWLKNRLKKLVVQLVVMSSELYEQLAQNARIGQAIYEAEKEVEEGAQPISLNDAMERLNKKYYG